MRKAMLFLVPTVLAVTAGAQNNQNFETEQLLNNINAEAAVAEQSENDANKDPKTLRRERHDFEFSAAAQASVTGFDNWAPGGQNTTTGRGVLLIRDQYRRNKLTIINQFDSRFGINVINDQTYKNEDEFKYFFLTTYKMVGNWSYAFSVNLRSQYARGYKDIDTPEHNSAFMAPGYIDVAMGFTYNKAPFIITLSPLASSIMTVLDEDLSNQGLNGITPGDRVRALYGSSVKIDYDQTFFENLRFRSSLYSFCDYKKEPNARWENTLTFSAGKYLTASAYCLLFYDPYSTTVTGLQTTYTVGIGLAYTFKNK